MPDSPFSKRHHSRADRPRPPVTEIDAAADAITDAVTALAGRWDKKTGGNRELDEAGTAEAFNPEDPETNRLFQTLWHAAFPGGEEPLYSPETQHAILAVLRRKDADIIPTMRKISHYSEREMEKGYARKAQEKLAGLPPLSGDVTNLVLAEVRALFPGQEVMNRRQTEALGSVTMLKMGTYDFPYQTYETMCHQELMMTMLAEGLDSKTLSSAPHLIVEGGALPFEAIYSSIFRSGGEVILTNQDEAAHRSASKLVEQLEKKGVLVRGKVKAVHVDPLSGQFTQMDWRQHSESGNPPLTALITQRVHGYGAVAGIMRILMNQHGIDTVLTRDGHGMVQMLYEPYSLKTLGRIAPQRLCTIPIHSEGTPRDEQLAEGMLFPRHMCYNTTRLFSARSLRSDWEARAAGTSNLFRVPDAPERVSAFK